MGGRGCEQEPLGAAEAEAEQQAAEAAADAMDPETIAAMEVAAQAEAAEALEAAEAAEDEADVDEDEEAEPSEAASEDWAAGRRNPAAAKPHLLPVQRDGSPSLAPGGVDVHPARTVYALCFCYIRHPTRLRSGSQCRISTFSAIVSNTHRCRRRRRGGGGGGGGGGG
jgi:hypothetical protein